MTATTTEQVITTDQNTAREISWIVEHISPVTSPRAGQFTHLLGVRRQNGKAAFLMWAEIDPTTNQVIRNSQPWRAGW